MASDDSEFDSPGDELEDHDYPNYEDDAGDFDDDSSETVPCPECGADVHEDSPRCPVCGTYVTHDTSIWSGRPTWWIVLAWLGVAALILSLLLGRVFGTT